MIRIVVSAALVAATMHGTAHAAADANEESRAVARSIFKELIEIDTSESGQGSTPAALAIAQRMKDAGFAESDIVVAGPNPRKQNVVVRLRGNGHKKPVLLIGHLDVVEARRSDWTTDPYQFVEKDGYFYGRGTQDMKDGDAIMAATLIRLKKEKFRSDRDIILALTADEEGAGDNGVDWLLKNRRDLIDAEFVLNHDGGGVLLENGKAVQMEVTASEKVYADFQLSTTNPGGHSSLPVPENAIYALSQGLTRLARYEFPFELNNVTRAYYEQIASRATGQRATDLKAMLATPPDQQAIARLSKDSIDHAIVRTTCVATRLEAGHANNALPQKANAVVNCRILPGHSPEEVRQTLIEVLDDSRIKVSYIATGGEIRETAPAAKGFQPPPLREDVIEPLRKVAGKMWPGTPVITSMAAGATDGVYTSAAGLPTYIVGGEAIERDDIRAHGQDERIAVKSFNRAVDFYYEYLREVVNYRK
ncbi:acetylornithine deacetylase/succinyl-diaminopimelate desuccinylase-like protein [Povalibacter uvarum]|uniref:Acetylornithine deacetylase/succinyl-diaminopimelate desuccinylase-like protein n=1 Tax=Povalibacter uvarum TaxID=732238 RepID=A0A841HKS8_9GAMM|nr:M20/M25/M40 family metallo-hydrolase [Povalibacter uvarum]MBB6092615.1 acetylornithine deacetylase/succinyl-diaminopimelate desuccinylase-like protein [Povalibacter uvarum]